ncbi:FAD/NAD(P)-binding protein [Amycolatopsis sp. NPDC049868]|uniref:FAD/NAD(P)-binding protein n=1 Tax=Amycolatopsis sp. NPDC049868 TaxID=3363934 RepID=UPI0037A94FA4
MLGHLRAALIDGEGSVAYAELDTAAHKLLAIGTSLNDSHLRDRAGQRGTSAPERICASARTPVTVHVVDPCPLGPSRARRTDQPEHLMMNTVAGQVTFFADDTVGAACLLWNGPS